MASEHRLQVTVSREMRVALGILASRNGIPIATQALVTLRQGLDRTIQSEECRRLVAESRQYQTNEAWRLDQHENTEVARAIEAAASHEA